MNFFSRLLYMSRWTCAVRMKNKKWIEVVCLLSFVFFYVMLRMNLNDKDYYDDQFISIDIIDNIISTSRLPWLLRIRCSRWKLTMYWHTHFWLWRKKKRRPNSKGTDFVLFLLLLVVLELCLTVYNSTLWTSSSWSLRRCSLVFQFTLEKGVI